MKKQLYISEASNPEEVKQMFSQWYPFLKIELYRTDTPQTEANRKIPPVVSKFGKLREEGLVDVSDITTVAQLISRIALMGLRTEIFRKCGNMWIETKLTDNWTLQQQNKAGEEISNHL